jgi:putative DNA primase/helicase
MMPMSLRAMAAALGGEVSGKSVLAPGPGHSAKDRSLSVTLSATSSSDGFMVYSHAGDDWQACRDYVRGKLVLSPFRPGQAPMVAPQRERKPIEEMPANNREPALRLWCRALEPRGTLVAAYLRNRCLELPREAANEAIRFHPDCPFGPGSARPAMVCLVRNIVSNEPQGLHRTALAPNGTAIKRDGKTFRMSLGTIAGGAIKLDPDEDVTQGLCIGEGVETCLAGRQMGLQPVWSAVNTGGVANFPVLPGVDGLHIFKENDAEGQSAKAVEACARRWYGAGRDVIIVEPDTAKDLNDELREAAR